MTPGEPLSEPGAAVDEEALRKAEEFIEQEEGAARHFTGWTERVLTAIAVAMSISKPLISPLASRKPNGLYSAFTPKVISPLLLMSSSPSAVRVQSCLIVQSESDLRHAHQPDSHPST